jgi:macrolide-specific efflux system membrane fusion protein
MTIDQKIAKTSGGGSPASGHGATVHEFVRDKGEGPERGPGEPSTPRPSLLNPFRREARKRAALFALPILVSLLAVIFLSKSGTESLANAEIVSATKGDVEQSVTALGNLQPRDYVDVGAQVSGQLKRINVNVGDTVKAGDLVAEIDAAVLAAHVEASKAQITSLQAQLNDRKAQASLAQAQFKRQAELMKANATSQDAYDTAEATANSAVAETNSLEAQIAQTQASLNADEVTLGYTKIYAPMAGTIVSISAKQGQTLNANQQAPIILRIADLSTMTVWTQVSEADVVKLRLGMEAYFMTLGNPDRRWTGKLQQILPTPDVVNNVVLYTALFDVANPKGDLMTQMSAQVFFVQAAARNVVTVPVSALKVSRRDPHRARVMVVTNLGTERVRFVTVGVTNRVTAEIKSGLDSGERVVVGQKAATPSSSSRSQNSQRANGQGGPGGAGGVGGAGGGFGRMRGF